MKESIVEFVLTEMHTFGRPRQVHIHGSRFTSRKFFLSLVIFNEFNILLFVNFITKT